MGNQALSSVLVPDFQHMLSFSWGTLSLSPSMHQNPGELSEEENDSLEHL